MKPILWGKNIFRFQDVFIPAMIRTEQAMAFSVTPCGNESQTLKKQDRKSTDAFKCCGWRSLLRKPWTNQPRVLS